MKMLFLVAPMPGIRENGVLIFKIAITSRGPKKLTGPNKNLTFLRRGVNFWWYFWAGPMRRYQ